jgi:predicted DNA-binding transcriptional regulator AlpA
MLMDMVGEVDLDRVEVPEGYEVLDATALAQSLGIKRETVLVYLSRRNFRNLPRPNRRLAMGPVWYEASVREWERSREGGQARERRGQYKPAQERRVDGPVRRAYGGGAQAQDRL